MPPSRRRTPRLRALDGADRPVAGGGRGVAAGPEPHAVAGGCAGAQPAGGDRRDRRHPVGDVDDVDRDRRGGCVSRSPPLVLPLGLSGRHLCRTGGPARPAFRAAVPAVAGPGALDCLGDFGRGGLRLPGSLVARSAGPVQRGVRDRSQRLVARLLVERIGPGGRAVVECRLARILVFADLSVGRLAGRAGLLRKCASSGSRFPRFSAEAGRHGRPTRRTVLGACTGVVGAAAGVALATWARTGRAAAARPLRPPGALDEARFAGVCVRCGNCSRACPAQIVRLDLGDMASRGCSPRGSTSGRTTAGKTARSAPKSAPAGR